ncbi:hypothetical protein IGI41_001797 [Enterococcus sp. DIV0876]
MSSSVITETAIMLMTSTTDFLVCRSHYFYVKRDRVKKESFDEGFDK